MRPEPSSASPTSASRPAALPCPLVVSVDLPAGRVVVCGELDRDCASHLLDALGVLRLTPQTEWTIDAARVGFCDAGGLRTLAQARDLARHEGHALRVADPSPFLARLLTLVGLDELLRPAPASHLRLLPAPAEPDQARGCSTKS